MLNPETGVPTPTALEELALPANIYSSFKRSLEASTSMLPETARRFMDWDVGLLDRYEERWSS